MSNVANKSTRGGGYDFKKDKDLIVYLLENAEIEHEVVGGVVETSKGINFIFDADTDELLDIEK